MNLGHGRAGHLPDYSFIRYRYLPAWGDYEEILKDNPSDYRHAFAQMVYAMKYLRGEYQEFECERYDFDAISPYENEIVQIITKRQPDSSEDWKALGERLSGHEIEPFDLDRYQDEYRSSQDKDESFLGRFILAALAQKSMVTNRIYNSKSKLAGYSIDYKKRGFGGMKAFKKLVKEDKA